jgi:PKD repeat protein
MKRTPLLIAALLAASVAAVSMPGAAVAAPPANDDFANATAISSMPFSDTVDVTEAGMEVGESSYCAVSHTAWYSFVADSDGIIRLDSSGSSFFGPTLNLYRQDGSGMGGLSFVGCSAYYQNPVTLSVQAGNTYYLQVGGSHWGGGNLHLSIAVVPPPSNDSFADATAVSALPFSDSVDTTAATVEPGEPTPSCGYGQSAGTVWYAFTPSQSGSYSASVPYIGFSSQVAAYTGGELADLNQIGCRAFGQLLTFHADAGTTYYLQAGGLFGSRGALTFKLDVAPDPVANFSYYPGDPSIFETVQFFDQSNDPGGVGISSLTWRFGDGSDVATGCCPMHRYAEDGDYAVQLDVTTPDGRTASIEHVVHVQTHDVTIAKVMVPQTASVGQTRGITVGLTNSRYAENVDVWLEKSVAGGGWQQVGVLTQYVPVRGPSRTTNFTFNYTFAPEDAVLGKVSFRASANIQNARDAIPADNTFISLPTKVR